MNGDKRYHAEIKLTLDAREVRINVYADTLAEIYRDLANICEQVPGPLKNAGHREIANAELKAAQLGIPTGTTGAKPQARAEETGEIPVCQHCSSQEFMELIEFTDKKTGKPRKAWKCQMCEKWHFENGKKK